MTENIFWSAEGISNEERWARQGHRGGVVWLTGLSGSGKSTLSRALELELFSEGIQVFVLDGDNLRHGLNSDLDFSPAARTENIRRAAEVGGILARAGCVAIVAFISPYRADRDRARRIVSDAQCDFIEVFVDAPLELCESRDPKHLYQRARAGEIRDFTGIGAPYERPEQTDIHIRSGDMSVAESIKLILEFLRPRLSIAAAGNETLHSATAFTDTTDLSQS